MLSSRWVHIWNKSYHSTTDAPETQVTEPIRSADPFALQWSTVLCWGKQMLYKWTNGTLTVILKTAHHDVCMFIKWDYSGLQRFSILAYLRGYASERSTSPNVINPRYMASGRGSACWCIKVKCFRLLYAGSNFQTIYFRKVFKPLPGATINLCKLSSSVNYLLGKNTTMFNCLKRL